MDQRTKTAVASALRAAAAKIEAARIGKRGSRGRGSRTRPVDDSIMPDVPFQTWGTDEDKLNDGLAGVPGLEQSAQRIVKSLSPLRSVDEEPALHARSLVDVLSNARGAKDKASLDDSFKVALTICYDLLNALKDARKTLHGEEQAGSIGEDDGASASEAIRDAVAKVTSLMNDIGAYG